MEIRKAKSADLDRIMPIYDYARTFMAENGNPGQWGDGYPYRADIAADIAAGNYYICQDQNHVCGGFALIWEEEPTYRVIEDGAWLSEGPYATIHRLASDGTCPGIAKTCFAWCQWRCRERKRGLRIDTHGDNIIMQHVIEDFGFEKCGIIRVRDGSPRIAYEKLLVQG